MSFVPRNWDEELRGTLYSNILDEFLDSLGFCNEVFDRRSLYQFCPELRGADSGAMPRHGVFNIHRPKPIRSTSGVEIMGSLGDYDSAPHRSRKLLVDRDPKFDFPFDATDLALRLKNNPRYTNGLGVRLATHVEEDLIREMAHGIPQTAFEISADCTISAACKTAVGSDLDLDQLDATWEGLGLSNNNSEKYLLLDEKTPLVSSCLPFRLMRSCHVPAYDVHDYEKDDSGGDVPGTVAPKIRYVSTGSDAFNGETHGNGDDYIMTDGWSNTPRKVLNKGTIIAIEGVYAAVPIVNRSLDDTYQHPTNIPRSFVVKEDVNCNASGQAKIKIAPEINASGSTTKYDDDLSSKIYCNVREEAVDNAPIWIVGEAGKSYHQAIAGVQSTAAVCFVPIAPRRIFGLDANAFIWPDPTDLSKKASISFAFDERRNRLWGYIFYGAGVLDIEQGVRLILGER